jgi:glutamate dehydrogenase (NAD(P)+)
MVAEGANIPRTAEAEAALEARKVLVLPDLVVNAGGVICAATEYRGGTETMAFGAIEEKIRRKYGRHNRRVAPQRPLYAASRDCIGYPPDPER